MWLRPNLESGVAGVNAGRWAGMGGVEMALPVRAGGNVKSVNLRRGQNESGRL